METETKWLKWKPPLQYPETYVISRVLEETKRKWKVEHTNVDGFVYIRKNLPFTRLVSKSEVVKWKLKNGS
jgi:hypothetical protein